MTSEDSRTNNPGRGWIGSLLPGVGVARTYRREWLHRDVIAGLVLTALLVPQGMAYAELAGLPAVTGLYATVVPLIAYALFGPSRILVLGPDSALAPLIAAAVIPIAGSNASERVAVAGLLALIVGGLLLVGAIARLGFLTDLFSKPVRLGYLSGIALIVIAAQVPRLLGVPVPSGDFVDNVGDLLSRLDRIEPATAAIGIGCLAVVLVLWRVAPRAPGILFAVGGAAILVSVFDLDVAVVGSVPRGLPSLTIPSPSIDDLGRLTLSAVAIALLAFADTSVLSRSYASRLGDRVDQSRELGGLAIANLATGLFQGFPTSSSSSRTPVAEAAGSRTQLTGVVAAVVIAVVLFFGTGLLETIPVAALAAVVIAAVLRLVDVPAYRWLLRVNRGDFALAVDPSPVCSFSGFFPGSDLRSRSPWSPCSRGHGIRIPQCSDGSRSSRAITTPSGTPKGVRSRGCFSFASTRRSSSRTPRCSETLSIELLRRSSVLCGRSSSRPSRSPMSTPLPRRCSARSTPSSTEEESSSHSRR